MIKIISILNEHVLNCRRRVKRCLGSQDMKAVQVHHQWGECNELFRGKVFMLTRSSNAFL